ncbi:hypothetical protein ABNC41_20810 [Paenibacillus larvae]
MSQKTERITSTRVASSVATSMPFSLSITVRTAKTAMMSIQLSMRVLSALPRYWVSRRLATPASRRIWGLLTKRKK